MRHTLMNKFHNQSALIIIAGAADDSECLGTIITSYSSAVIKDPSTRAGRRGFLGWKCLCWTGIWLQTPQGWVRYRELEEDLAADKPLARAPTTTPSTSQPKGRE